MLKINVPSRGDFYYSLKSKKIVARLREKPQVERIPPEELEDAILKTLDFNYALPVKDLVKEASKYFGFKNILIQHTTLADVNFVANFNYTFYKI